MHLPDLLPDAQFHLLPRNEEAFQMQTHQAHFREKPFFKIARDGRDVGTESVMRFGDRIRFGEFYLFPDYQGEGLGTRVLQHCLAIADEQGVPVRLEYLKWNPIGALYRRNGFAVVGETETHWFMDRAPVKPTA